MMPPTRLSSVTRTALSRQPALPALHRLGGPASSLPRIICVLRLQRRLLGRRQWSSALLGLLGSMLRLARTPLSVLHWPSGLGSQLAIFPGSRLLLYRTVRRPSGLLREAPAFALIVWPAMPMAFTCCAVPAVRGYCLTVMSQGTARCSEMNSLTSLQRLRLRALV